MIMDNKEYIYFFVSAFLFLGWSLLAGILLPTEDRYIGLCLSALAVLIIYLYTKTQVYDTRTMKISDAVQIKQFKYN